LYFCGEKNNKKFDGRRESKQRKGRRGRERERERRERENEEVGTLYVFAIAQCGLQPAAGVARRRRRYFLRASSIHFLILKKTSGLLGFLGYCIGLVL
jgi:hypothetical protein